MKNSLDVKMTSSWMANVNVNNGINDAYGSSTEEDTGANRTADS